VNDLTKNVLVFIVIIVVLLSVVQGLSGVSGGQIVKKDYSEFQTQVQSGQVSIVEFDGEQGAVAGQRRDPVRSKGRRAPAG